MKNKEEYPSKSRYSKRQTSFHNNKSKNINSIKIEKILKDLKIKNHI